MNIRKTFLHASLLLSVLLLAGGCRNERIVIVSTNDMHGAIDNFPKLATLVEGLRAENPGRVLLIDAGDRWSGNPYVDMAAEPGKPIIELMDELGYDLATYGNHEWDSGTAHLARRMEESRFASVLANADMSASPMPETAPYKILEVGKTRLAFLGLVTTAVNGHPDGKEENFDRIVFYDPWETAARYAPLADSADVYVALTHIGLNEDSLLAVQRPGIDLIIGGHSHDLVPVGRRINETVVTQTGSRLRYAGVTTLRVRCGKLRGIDNRVVMLDTLPADPLFEAMVEGYRKFPGLTEKVGEVTGPMDKTALMNFYSDAMREGTFSDFAFYNMGGMRTSEFAGGGVTRGDVFSAEPFRNTAETFLMSMDDIKAMILNKFNSTGKESHTLDLYPSGMTYRIVTDGQGNGTDVIFRHSVPDKRGGKYKVALSDYVGAVYDFPQRGAGTATLMYVADLAIARFKKLSPVAPDPRGRVVIE